MTCGPFEDLRSHRRISALVADHVSLDPGEPSIRITAHGVGHLYRMAFGVKSQTLFAAKRELHGTAGDLREQSGLSLDAHVLLTAERTTVCHKRDEHFFLRHREKRCDLTTIVKDALTLSEHSQAIALRHCDARLGLEIHMLDELSLKCVR